MPTVGRTLKRVLLGRPLATEEAPHQLLPKRLALPVFASDPLSSNAYATEEILIVLSLAGAGALSLVTPLSLVIASVVVIVITSYRQTVRAYPRGGGSYLVSRENLGTNYGLIAAAALLTDYVLTVAVSIAAGVAAITSAAPTLAPHRVSMSIGFILLVMVANLRGVKESGTFFAIPTYTFVLSIWIMLGAGAVQCVGGCPKAETASLPLDVTGSLTIFIILRAFASGSTALTGIEAIADGVPAFRGRRPSEQARNASTTLAIMGGLTLSMFLGISLLARSTGVRPLEEKTVVAQIADTVFHGGFLFFFVQATTAGILILAANTAYADFPRLSSILARDRFMPRQFLNRGDRLVFSNGVIALSSMAILLIWAFDASVTSLIQLYVVGVFTTFTLSQSGMVMRWRRLRPPGWRRKATMNAIGAATTGVVLLVVAQTKFVHGAWIVIAAIPVIIAGFKAVSRHYASVGHQLRVPEGRPRPTAATRALVIVPRIDEAAMRALGYARALRPLEVRAVHVPSDGTADAMRASWAERRIAVPLDVVESDGDLVDAVRDRVRAMHRSDDEYVTVVLPEAIRRRGLGGFLRTRRELMLKAAMLFEPHVVVTDVTTFAEGTEGGDAGPIAPTRNVAIVLVSAVHNATLRALAYASAIRPTELRAVTFNVDETQTGEIMREWAQAEVDVPLEVIDSPYREVTRPLLKLVKQIRSGAPDTVVTVIVPEFVVSKWYQQFLHNQTALGIKSAMLFEPGVVVTSVPFHLV